MNNLYITERMRTYWLHVSDELWDEKYTPYSDDFDLCPDCLL